MAPAPAPAVALWLVALAIASQDPASLQARLDPATYEAIRPMLDAARRDSVPVRALEAKALEGAAKRRPSPQIVAAVSRLADELRAARGVLRQAAQGPLPEGEVQAAADALRRGVPASELVELRRSAPSEARLEIAIAVLGELVDRGVPAGEARDAITQLVESGLPPGQVVEVPARVDVALRVGAPPGAALASVLRGMGVPRPTAPPGRGRRPGRPVP